MAQRLILVWGVLVLAAVVLLALRGAPNIIVLGLLAFLPRPYSFDPPSRGQSHMARERREDNSPRHASE